MAGPASLAPTPSDIGGVAQPVFAVLPDPERLFLDRAERFEALAPGHPLEAYLRFLGALSRAQHALVAEQPRAPAPDPDLLARARDFAMPPLDRARMRMDDAIHAAFERLLEMVDAIPMPEPAAEAVRRLRDAGRDGREAVLSDALDSAAGADALAEHVFAAAALQAHFTRLAAALDADTLQPVGAGACPCCGGPPAVSLVVGWGPVHGARYVSCALCGTLWNHVRVKCVACESTEKISYHALSEDGETLAGGAMVKAREDETPIKAETCDDCGLYVKIFHQHLKPSIDPVADDVASLGLDLKVREAGWARAGFNPYLLGY